MQNSKGSKPSPNHPQESDPLTFEARSTSSKFTDPDFPPSSRSLSKNPESRLSKHVGFAPISSEPHLQALPLIPQPSTSLSLKSIGIGHHYFVSALKLMSLNPVLLNRIFLGKKTADDQEIYSVMVCDTGEWRFVRIDEYLPIQKRNRRPAFITTEEGRLQELWPLILEKVYAKCLGAYDLLSVGCFEHTIRDLTGACYYKFCEENANGKALQSYLLNSLSKDYLVTCSLKQPILKEDVLPTLYLINKIVTPQGLLKSASKNAQQLDKKLEETDLWVSIRDLSKSGNDDEAIVNINELWTKYEEFCTIKLNNNFKYSSIRMRHEKSSEQSFLKLTVDKPTEIFLSVNQKDARCFVPKTSTDFNYYEEPTPLIKMEILDIAGPDFSLGFSSRSPSPSKSRLESTPQDFTYTYSTTRLLVAKIIPGVGLKYIDGTLSRGRNTQLALNLEPGAYIILTEIHWAQDRHKDFTVSFYSDDNVKVQGFRDFDTEVFIQALVKDFIEPDPTKTPRQKKEPEVFNYAESGCSDISKSVGMAAGFIWFHYRNESKVQTLFEEIEVVIQNLVIMQTDAFKIVEGNPSEARNNEEVTHIQIRVPPGAEKCILFKLTDLEYACRYKLNSQIQHVSQVTPRGKPPLHSKFPTRMSPGLVPQFREDQLGEVEDVPMNDLYNEVMANSSYVTKSPEKKNQSPEKERKDQQDSTQVNRGRIPEKSENIGSTQADLKNLNVKDGERSPSQQSKGPGTLGALRKKLNYSRQASSEYKHLEEDKKAPDEKEPGNLNVKNQDKILKSASSADRILLKEQDKVGNEIVGVKNPLLQNLPKWTKLEPPKRIKSAGNSGANTPNKSLVDDQIPDNKSDAQTNRSLYNAFNNVLSNVLKDDSIIKTTNGTPYKPKESVKDCLKRVLSARKIRSQGLDTPTRVDKESFVSQSLTEASPEKSSLWLIEDDKTKKLGEVINKRITNHKKIEDYLRFEHSLIQTARVVNSSVRRILKETFEMIQYTVTKKKRLRESFKLVILRSEQRWKRCLTRTLLQWQKFNVVKDHMSLRVVILAKILDLKLKQMQNYMFKELYGYSRFKEGLSYSNQNIPTTQAKGMMQLFTLLLSSELAQKQAFFTKAKILSSIEMSRKQETHYRGFEEFSKAIFKICFRRIRKRSQLVTKILKLLKARQNHLNKALTKAFTIIHNYASSKEIIEQEEEKYRSLLQRNLMQNVLYKLSDKVNIMKKSTLENILLYGIYRRQRNQRLFDLLHHIILKSKALTFGYFKSIIETPGKLVKLARMDSSNQISLSVIKLLENPDIAQISKQKISQGGRSTLSLFAKILEEKLHAKLQEAFYSIKQEAIINLLKYQTSSKNKNESENQSQKAIKSQEQNGDFDRLTKPNDNTARTNQKKDKNQKTNDNNRMEDQPQKAISKKDLSAPETQDDEEDPYGASEFNNNRPGTNQQKAKVSNQKDDPTQSQKIAPLGGISALKSQEPYEDSDKLTIPQDLEDLYGASEFNNSQPGTNQQKAKVSNQKGGPTQSQKIAPLGGVSALKTQEPYEDSDELTTQPIAATGKKDPSLPKTQYLEEDSASASRSNNNRPATNQQKAKVNNQKDDPTPSQKINPSTGVSTIKTHEDSDPFFEPNDNTSRMNQKRDNSQASQTNDERTGKKDLSGPQTQDEEEDTVWDSEPNNNRPNTQKPNIQKEDSTQFQNMKKQKKNYDQKNQNNNNELAQQSHQAVSKKDSSLPKSQDQQEDFVEVPEYPNNRTANQQKGRNQKAENNTGPINQFQKPTPSTGTSNFKTEDEEKDANWESGSKNHRPTTNQQKPSNQKDDQTRLQKIIPSAELPANQSQEPYENSVPFSKSDDNTARTSKKKDKNQKTNDNNGMEAQPQKAISKKDLSAPETQDDEEDPYGASEFNNSQPGTNQQKAKVSNQKDDPTRSQKIAPLGGVSALKTQEPYEDSDELTTQPIAATGKKDPSLPKTQYLEEESASASRSNNNRPATNQQKAKVSNQKDDPTQSQKINTSTGVSTIKTHEDSDPFFEPNDNTSRMNQKRDNGQASQASQANDDRAGKKDLSGPQTQDEEEDTVWESEPNNNKPNTNQQKPKVNPSIEASTIKIQHPYEDSDPFSKHDDNTARVNQKKDNNQTSQANDERAGKKDFPVLQIQDKEEYSVPVPGVNKNGPSINPQKEALEEKNDLRAQVQKPSGATAISTFKLQEPKEDAVLLDKKDITNQQKVDNQKSEDQNQPIIYPQKAAISKEPIVLKGQEPETSDWLDSKVGDQNVVNPNLQTGPVRRDRAGYFSREGVFSVTMEELNNDLARSRTSAEFLKKTLSYMPSKGSKNSKKENDLDFADPFGIEKAREEGYTVRDAIVEVDLTGDKKINKKYVRRLSPLKNTAEEDEEMQPKEGPWQKIREEHPYIDNNVSTPTWEMNYEMSKAPFGKVQEKPREEMTETDLETREQSIELTRRANVSHMSRKEDGVKQKEDPRKLRERGPGTQDQEELSSSQHGQSSNQEDIQNSKNIKSFTEVSLIGVKNIHDKNDELSENNTERDLRQELFNDSKTLRKSGSIRTQALKNRDMQKDDDGDDKVRYLNENGSKYAPSNNTRKADLSMETSSKSSKPVSTAQQEYTHRNDTLTIGSQKPSQVNTTDIESSKNLSLCITESDISKIEAYSRPEKNLLDKIDKPDDRIQNRNLDPKHQSPQEMNMPTKEKMERGQMAWGQDDWAKAEKQKKDGIGAPIDKEMRGGNRPSLYGSNEEVLTPREASATFNPRSRNSFENSLVQPPSKDTNRTKQTTGTLIPEKLSEKLRNPDTSNTKTYENYIRERDAALRQFEGLPKEQDRINPITRDSVGSRSNQYTDNTELLDSARQIYSSHRTQKSRPSYDELAQRKDKTLFQDQGFYSQRQRNMYERSKSHGSVLSEERLSPHEDTDKQENKHSRISSSRSKAHRSKTLHYGDEENPFSFDEKANSPTLEKISPIAGVRKLEPIRRPEERYERIDHRDKGVAKMRRESMEPNERRFEKITPRTGIGASQANNKEEDAFVRGNHDLYWSNKDTDNLDTFEKSDMKSLLNITDRNDQDKRNQNQFRSPTNYKEERKLRKMSQRSNNENHAIKIIRDIQDLDFSSNDKKGHQRQPSAERAFSTEEEEARQYQSLPIPASKTNLLTLEEDRKPVKQLLNAQSPTQYRLSEPVAVQPTSMRPSATRNFYSSSERETKFANTRDSHQNNMNLPRDTYNRGIFYGNMVNSQRSSVNLMYPGAGLRQPMMNEESFKSNYPDAERYQRSGQPHASYPNSGINGEEDYNKFGYPGYGSAYSSNAPEDRISVEKSKKTGLHDSRVNPEGYPNSSIRWVQNSPPIQGLGPHYGPYPFFFQYPPWQSPSIYQSNMIQPPWGPSNFNSPDPEKVKKKAQKTNPENIYKIGVMVGVLDKLYSLEKIKAMNQAFQALIVHQHKLAFKAQNKVLKLFAIFKKKYLITLSQAFTYWRTDLEVCKAEFLISKKLKNVKKQERNKILNEICSALKEEGLDQDDIVRYLGNKSPSPIIKQNETSFHGKSSNISKRETPISTSFNLTYTNPPTSNFPQRTDDSITSLPPHRLQYNAAGNFYMVNSSSENSREIGYDELQQLNLTNKLQKTQLDALNKSKGQGLNMSRISEETNQATSGRITRQKTGQVLSSQQIKMESKRYLQPNPKSSNSSLYTDMKTDNKEESLLAEKKSTAHFTDSHYTKKLQHDQELFQINKEENRNAISKIITEKRDRVRGAIADELSEIRFRLGKIKENAESQPTLYTNEEQLTDRSSRTKGAKPEKDSNMAPPNSYRERDQILIGFGEEKVLRKRDERERQSLPDRDRVSKRLFAESKIEASKKHATRYYYE